MKIISDYSDKGVEKAMLVRKRQNHIRFIYSHTPD